MAETFQRVIKSTVSQTATFDSLYTCPGSTTAIIIGLQVANVHATDACWVTVRTKDTAGTSTGSQISVIANQISIPVNDTLAPIQGKLVLEANQEISATAQTASSLDLTLSILEIS
jgi:hypothetical protein